MKTMNGIARAKPEHIFVVWLSWKRLWIMKGRPTFPLCDFCNRDIDWDPFPVIDYSPKEQVPIDYFPIGGEALCMACAAKYYGLTKKDTRKIKRLWYCFDMMQTSD